MTFFRPLFRATKGGLFFLALLAGPLRAAGPGALAVDRAGDRWVAVGEKGRILLSENRWETWRQAESPVEVTLTAVRFLDHRMGWAVGHEGVILKTEDGGGRWRLLRSAPAADEPLFDVLFQNPAQGMAVGAYGLCLRTEDGGITWTNISLPSGDRHLYGVASPRPGVWVVVGEGDHPVICGRRSRLEDHAGERAGNALRRDRRPEQFPGGLRIQRSGVGLPGRRGPMEATAEEGPFPLRRRLGSRRRGFGRGRNGPRGAGPGDLEDS
ncbi:MAG: hypothetical protein IPP35_09255 [Elusimicrobia bacterium]|nr:hypothetical protein [Elusimicrobiota bacterium]